MSIQPVPRASDALAAWIDSQLGDPELEAPLTLGQVRRRLLRALDARGSLHDGALSDPDASWYGELDALIAAYGESASAADFARPATGVSLSDLIEAMLERDGTDASTTLGEIRTALVEGGLARLVDDGVLESADCDGVLSEIDALVDRFGAEIPAAELLGLG